MEKLIDLSYFGAKKKHYHIYAIHDGIRGEHYHDYFHLLYVKNGRVEHIHNKSSITLLPGEAFLIPPLFSHSCSFSGEDTVAYSLAFSPDLFHSGFSQSNIYCFLSRLSRAAAEQGELKLKVGLSHRQCGILEKLLDCLIEEQEDAPESDLSAAPSLISASLYILAQAWGPLAVDEAGNAAAGCKQYIDGHYMDGITLEVLCRKFAVSRSLLCTSFRKLTGETIKQYVRKKRILAAESMIRRNPSASLNAVAAAVGFSDPSSFYRNFSNFVGISPSAYKQSVKAEH